MRNLGRWLHLLYAAYVCICMHSIGIQAIRVYDSSPKILDSKVTQTRHSFREPIDEVSRFMGKKLIPIKSSRVSRNFALPLEPDAEMLPAHYKGVKPPGVDHMELKYAESRISKATPKLESSKKFEQVSRGQESESANDEEGHERVVSSERGEKGDQLNQKEKSEYVELGGKKKIRDEHDNDSGYNSEKFRGEGGAFHRIRDSDKVDRVATGYRNVYHKDEHKKNHDFYDNDDQGGHSKKHERYNEKHTSSEGRFKKGGSHDSSFDQEETRKQGATKNSQTEEETKGHDAHQGDYDRFLKNFQGFAKQ